MYISDTQQKIIEAFLLAAERNGKFAEITMLKVANLAGMTPQSIYRKHFKSIANIVETARMMVMEDIFKKLDAAHATDPSLSPLALVAKEVLPVMYQYRSILKVFYRREIDPDWYNFLEEHFTEWARPFLKKDITELDMPREWILSLGIKIVLMILSQWIIEDEPIPPNIFRGYFLDICDILHLSDFIAPELHD